MFWLTTTTLPTQMRNLLRISLCLVWCLRTHVYLGYPHNRYTSQLHIFTFCILYTIIANIMIAQIAWSERFAMSMPCWFTFSFRTAIARGCAHRTFTTKSTVWVTVTHLLCCVSNKNNTQTVKSKHSEKRKSFQS